MNRSFVIATGNLHKAEEIAEIFSGRTGAAIEVSAITALDGGLVAYLCSEPATTASALAAIDLPRHAPDVEETGATLAENARIKAVGVARALGVTAIADDTGLEVDALGGLPGVHSARYAGPNATYEQNCEKLLAEMTERKRASRTARFVTVALSFDPTTGAEIVATGKVEGTILDSARGTNGFGYDPLFAPAGGGGRTFAEMSMQEKQAVSHRARAFEALANIFV